MFILQAFVMKVLNDLESSSLFSDLREDSKETDGPVVCGKNRVCRFRYRADNGTFPSFRKYSLSSMIMYF